MPDSLSVIVPVRNAQSTLAPTVREILETVCEWTDNYELWIVDDASQDATCEVATDLSRQYPQVYKLCLTHSKGPDAAIRQGILQSRGEIVLLYDAEGGMTLGAVGDWWRSRASKPRSHLDLTEPASLAPPVAEWAPGRNGLPDRPHLRTDAGTAIPSAPKSPASGFRLIDRRTYDPARYTSRPARPVFLDRAKAAGGGRGVEESMVRDRA